MLGFSCTLFASVHSVHHHYITHSDRAANLPAPYIISYTSARYVRGLQQKHMRCVQVIRSVTVQNFTTHSAASTSIVTLCYDSRVVSSVQILAQHIPDTYSSKTMIFFRSYSGATPQLHSLSPLHVMLVITVHAIVVDELGVIWVLECSVYGF